MFAATCRPPTVRGRAGRQVDVARLHDELGVDGPLGFEALVQVVQLLWRASVNLKYTIRPLTITQILYVECGTLYP